MKEQAPPSPNTDNECFKSINNVTDLHGGLLLDYLTKVNKFNKILLNKINDLNVEYDEVLIKLEIKTADDSTKDESSRQHHLPSAGTRNETQSIDDQRSSNLIQAKFEEIEQNRYSNVIVCSGDEVNEIVTKTNNNDCKRGIMSKISEIVPGVTSSDITSVIPVGKERKCLKLICTDTHVKNTILREARIKKLPNIFYGEFLTSLRNNLYYQLKTLKRKFPVKIRLVYTRNGKIYYKLNGIEKYYLVRGHGDITHLVSRLNNE